MKTRQVNVLTAVVLSVCAGAWGDQLRITGGPLQFGAGGEFTATPDSGFAGLTGLFSDLGATSMQTFCLERNELVATGPGSSGTANLYDYEIGTAAMAGGYGGGNPDTISAATAFLYTQFRTGELDGYAFAGTSAERAESAEALQIAIWTLEQEYEGTSPDPVPVNAQASTWVTAALAAAANPGIWGDTIGLVRVLVLSQGGERRQDMLTLIPLPAAAYTGLAALGVAGVLRVRRRRPEAHL